MDLGQTGDVFKIVGGIIALLNFVGIIFIFMANKMAFHKIMTNDLHHLSSDIKGLKEEQGYINDKITKVCESVAYIRGQADILFAPRKRVRSVSKSKTSVRKVKAKA